MSIAQLQLRANTHRYKSAHMLKFLSCVQLYQGQIYKVSSNANMGNRTLDQEKYAYSSFDVLSVHRNFRNYQTSNITHSFLDMTEKQQQMKVLTLFLCMQNSLCINAD